MSRIVMFNRPCSILPLSIGGIVLGTTPVTECTIIRDGPPKSKTSPLFSRTVRCSESSNRFLYEKSAESPR